MPDDPTVEPETGDPEPTTEPTKPPETGDEVAKWKALSRENESAAKKARKELEELRQQNETDQERKIREAVEASRNETLIEVSGDRVADAIRVAASKRSIDVETLIEGIDAGRFLGDDGRPDTAKVSEWVNKIAPEIPETSEPNPFPDVGQGHTGAGVPALNSTQLEDDLRRAVGAP